MKSDGYAQKIESIIESHCASSDAPFRIAVAGNNRLLHALISACATLARKKTAMPKMRDLKVYLLPVEAGDALAELIGRSDGW